MEITIRQVSPENQHHPLTYDGFFYAHDRDAKEPGFSTWSDTWTKAWREGERILKEKHHPFRRTGNPDDIFPWIKLTDATLDELWSLLNGISVVLPCDGWLKRFRVIFKAEDLIAEEFNKKITETVYPLHPDFMLTTNRLQFFDDNKI